MTRDEHLIAFRYYLAQYHGAKTEEARNAWAHLTVSELPNLIDSIADIDPMLALHSKEAK